ncbi:helix-turn-helix domain-containing protein [Cytobacillus firmus]|uniref:helix-turn-helix domain-containing protein n=1 Tax=Cytobacillus firmus TaxID=1399 RepID=UPI001C8F19EF|nr:helix-turn-helix domain-containing protein [Cytobacillus firmus]MBX9974283.1 helix-turn-helix domain-containing protein [Cytobacillus firmus]
MVNKVDVLMHPVRMKICQSLMRNKENGLTPLEMVKIIKDVPQATLYRQLQIMMDSGIIHVIKEKKVKSVSEKYYALKEDQAKIDAEEWKKASQQQKLDYVTYYQLSLLYQYQSYLKKLEEQNNSEDSATFSLAALALDDEKFKQFQNELNELINKYYHNTSENNAEDTAVRTVAITMIPDA